MLINPPALNGYVLEHKNTCLQFRCWRWTWRSERCGEKDERESEADENDGGRYKDTWNCWNERAIRKIVGCDARAGWAGNEKSESKWKERRAGLNCEWVLNFQFQNSKQGGKWSFKTVELKQKNIWRKRITPPTNKKYLILCIGD